MQEQEEKRGKMKFMQKYYHKGAFFQSDADDKTGTVGTFEILQRDFSAPVGMDKFDKTALPSVLHVRHSAIDGWAGGSSRPCLARMARLLNPVSICRCARMTSARERGPSGRT